MKITICGSIALTPNIIEILKELQKTENEVLIPSTSEKIHKGEISLDGIKKDKTSGDIVERVIREDLIREHYKKIKSSEAILVANFDKNNIKNYIGGNTLMEMGFAHVLNKKIYLFNDIPEMIYTEEIRAMQPIILYKDLKKIK
ncbi:hypothetical protein C0584_00315 [Candidatus Parcubacteria bacterium]|nr:MAG: hypothetical protein C0584_00315 [Candidatus Parcubacteria bacterium]